MIYRRYRYYLIVTYRRFIYRFCRHVNIVSPTSRRSVMSVIFSNVFISGTLLSWLQKFFTGRTQCTKIGAVLSHITDVISGVIQGSVLGPLMFLTLSMTLMWTLFKLLLMLCVDGLRPGNYRSLLTSVVSCMLVRVTCWSCRLHCDLIWCYKIVFGLVSLEASTFFDLRPSSITRGHLYKIFKRHCYCTARSVFFRACHKHLEWPSIRDG